MKKFSIRVWKSLPLDEIKSSLLIVGDSSGDCSSCKALGLSYEKHKNCPECGVPFKYIASRSKDRYRWAGRIADKRPDLIFIDYDDYKKWTGKSQAYELLGGGSD